MGYYLKLDGAVIDFVEDISISKDWRLKTEDANLWGDELVDVGAMKTQIRILIDALTPETMAHIEAAKAKIYVTAEYYDGNTPAEKTVRILGYEKAAPWYLSGKRENGVLHTGFEIILRER